ncbi:MAG: glycosyl transferase family 1 [Crocinitomicaceae bacterium]|jgi:glycosyltransferase involved in cell wall biosynthesis|nr:glycosyl transferase family 1 [Crocinitomicaceae bacterium]
MPASKHVLLITYYWPPGGGPGVHRWLRFSKYFNENGLKLHVYCPQDAAWPIIDPELQKQVDPSVIEVRNSIFEPHKYLGKKNNPNVGGGLTQKGKSSVLQRLIIWVRGNLFIPDARVFWINPSYRFLKNYLREHPEIKTVISTGPPHSLHVIALKLKRKIDFKWVADFRDPWTEIDFYDDLNIGKWADTKQKRLEKACLQTADEVITVSASCADGLEKIGEREVKVITNGYDFPEFDPSSIEMDSDFSLSHFGSLPASRNPKMLWKALGQLVSENTQIRERLRIKLFGPVDYSIFEAIEQNGLSAFVSHVEMLKHAESILEQRKVQMLLLIANNTGNVKGILTGKFFEYLGAKRPILAVGLKESDLEKAVKDTACGEFFDYDELEQMKSYLLNSFEKYQAGILQVNTQNLEQFTSRNLARKVCELC